MARASGPIGLVITAMSFYLFALVVWMALRYRTSIAMPRLLIRELHELLEQKKYSEAYHRLVADESLLARILTAGVRKLPAGLPMAQRAMELANENATMEMEHRTTYLATVGTLGPMIGLVGTVYGMIMAFRVIALRARRRRPASLPPASPPRSSRHSRGSPFRFRRSSSTRCSATGSPGCRSRWPWGPSPSSSSSSPEFAPRNPAISPSMSHPQPPMPMPIGGPGSHPHPFAVSATLAAAPNAGPPRSALPPSLSDLSRE